MKIVIDIPDEQQYQEPYSRFDNRDGYNNPCEYCMNNPKNNKFATGFCNCALPALMNPMY